MSPNETVDIARALYECLVTRVFGNELERSSELTDQEREAIDAYLDATATEDADDGLDN
jgi:hypothetical protein